MRRLLPIAALLAVTAAADPARPTAAPFHPTGRLNQFRGFVTPRPVDLTPPNANYMYASVWASWSSWSFCVNNVRIRVRACNTVRGFSCLGHNQESRPCEPGTPGLRHDLDQKLNSDYDVVDPWEADRREAMRQLAPEGERDKQREPTAGPFRAHAAPTHRRERKESKVEVKENVNVERVEVKMSDSVKVKERAQLLYDLNERNDYMVKKHRKHRKNKKGMKKEKANETTTTTTTTTITTTAKPTTTTTVPTTTTEQETTTTTTTSTTKTTTSTVKLARKYEELQRTAIKRNGVKNVNGRKVHKRAHGQRVTRQHDEMTVPHPLAHPHRPILRGADQIDGDVHLITENEARLKQLYKRTRHLRGGARKGSWVKKLGGKRKTKRSGHMRAERQGAEFAWVDGPDYDEGVLAEHNGMDIVHLLHRLRATTTPAPHRVSTRSPHVDNAVVRTTTEEHTTTTPATTTTTTTTPTTSPFVHVHRDAKTTTWLTGVTAASTPGMPAEFAWVESPDYDMDLLRKGDGPRTRH